jgi:hypothetical protein
MKVSVEELVSSLLLLTAHSSIGCQSKLLGTLLQASWKKLISSPVAIRENVIDFMPYGFERVNKASEEMLLKEHRYV